MHVAAWQAILIVLLGMIKNVDQYGTQYLAFQHVTFCWLVGIILGDPLTGLSIGATIQLMSMGVAGLGGASVPDYGLAGMVGTVLAITSGQDLSVGLAVGLAVGMLGVQLDVLFKLFNSFINHRAQAYAKQGKYESMIRIMWVSPVFYAVVTNGVPMFLVLFFGSDAVNFVLNVLPDWFTTGLSIAGGMLPVVGMAMLLNFMPAKKFLSFVVVGYVLSSFAGLSILPIALLGAAAAYEYYKMHVEVGSSPGGVSLEGELEDE